MIATIKLRKYGQIISEKQTGNEIYLEIKKELENSENLIIDFDEIISMATFCAKQIFGRLYIALTPSIFFQRILLKNVSDDLKVIIGVGIQNALEENETISI